MIEEEKIRNEIMRKLKENFPLDMLEKTYQDNDKYSNFINSLFRALEIDFERNLEDMNSVIPDSDANKEEKEYFKKMVIGLSDTTLEEDPTYKAFEAAVKKRLENYEEDHQHYVEASGRNYNEVKEKAKEAKEAMPSKNGGRRRKSRRKSKKKSNRRKSAKKSHKSRKGRKSRRKTAKKSRKNRRRRRR